MDSFDWNYTPHVDTGTSSSWSNKQHDHMADHLRPVFGLQEAAKSAGTCSTWREATNIERTHNLSKQKTAINGLHELKGKRISTSTGLLDSLDSLLSKTNRHTDSSAGDNNGVPVEFSDCRNSWDNYINTTHAGNSHFHNNEFSGIFSQTFRGQVVNQLRSSGRKQLYTTKKSNTEIHTKSKKPRSDHSSNSSSINFQQPLSSAQDPDAEATAQMKQMIYQATAFRPLINVNLNVEVREKPRRKNVKISTDPQTVAARQRRERLSERIRALQMLVPGGNKMDTASMLDEAANYLKFLRSQIKALEELGHAMGTVKFPFVNSFAMHSNFYFQNPNHHSNT